MAGDERFLQNTNQGSEEQAQQQASDEGGEEQAQQQAGDEGGEEQNSGVEGGEQNSGVEDDSDLVEDDGSDLFSDPEESQDEDDIFEVPDTTDDGKKVSLKAFRKRVGRLTAQRERAREEAQALKEELAELRGRANVLETELGQSRELTRAFQEKYGGFKNPTEQFAWDANFMETAETLAKTNPEVRAAINVITQHTSGGRILNTGRSREEEAAARKAQSENEERKPDPTVTALLKQNARRTVEDALSAVKPAFRSVIAEHILTQPNVDLAGLDTPTVKSLASKFIRANGFSRDEVLARPPKPKTVEGAEGGEKASDGKAKSKPVTGGKGGAVATTTGKRAGGKAQDDQPKPPQSRNEWEARKQERLTALFGEVQQKNQQ